MKMLAVFEKGARLRHIGHLDLMRAMQRALRRSDLPIRYSQGFSPHILLTFAAPLSLGNIGKREIMEIPLEKPLQEAYFSRVLSGVLPQDIRIVQVRATDDQHKSPMALLRAARYQIDFSSASFTQEELSAFLNQEDITVQKKTKSGVRPTDIKPMIYELTSQESSIWTTLSLCEERSCKPELLLHALAEFCGKPLPQVLITRLALFAEKDGCFIPLEDA